MLNTLKNIYQSFHGKSRAAERGNVLFLILIAVVLFAALSYAVTQSSRSGGGGTDGEANLVNSAQITQYPASVRTAIVRMIIGGVDVSQLEFNRPSEYGSLTDNSFGVFHPNGGGATFVTAPASVTASGAQAAWIFNSRFEIQDIGTTTGTGSGNDVIAFLPGVGTAICTRLNTELGITTTDDNDGNGVPDAGIAIGNIPTEAMNQDGGNTGIGAFIGAIDTDFAGQPFGCADFDDAGAGTNNGDLVYYHVLVER